MYARAAYSIGLSDIEHATEASEGHPVIYDVVAMGASACYEQLGYIVLGVTIDFVPKYTYREKYRGTS